MFLMRNVTIIEMSNSNLGYRFWTLRPLLNYKNLFFRLQIIDDQVKDGGLGAV